MRHAAGRLVLFQPAIKTVCCLKNGGRSSKDCGVKNGTGIVDQFGEGIRGSHAEAFGESPFQSGLQRVISRMPHIVAIKRDGREARKWPQELLPCNGWTAERRRFGNLSEVRVGDLLRQG